MISTPVSAATFCARYSSGKHDHPIDPERFFQRYSSHYLTCSQMSRLRLHGRRRIDVGDDRHHPGIAPGATARTSVGVIEGRERAGPPAVSGISTVLPGLSSFAVSAIEVHASEHDDIGGQRALPHAPAPGLSPTRSATQWKIFGRVCLVVMGRRMTALAARAH